MAKYAAHFVVMIGTIVAEDFYLKENYGSLYETSNGALAAPRAFGLVVLVNVVISALVVMMIGFSVGGARSKFTARALKEGDKDAEKRFSLPKMQAEGFTDAAFDFNNLQRGHQQILESYQIYLVTAVLGGLEYPVAVAMYGVIWMKARMDWAAGYKEGGPKNRYNKGIALQVWFALLVNLFASGKLAYKMLMN